MLTNPKRVIAAALAVLALAAGCSSSKSGSPSPTVPASAAPSTSLPPSKGTYTVGVLSDLTGLAASGNKTSVQGVQAAVASIAAQAGYTIKYVTADTASSPTGVLSAAQQLVEQDHVLAVISVSSLTFLASNYLTSKGVPVIGVAEDGPEWITAANMFSVYGALDTTKVATTAGQFFKMEGVTNVGTLGYDISPTSAEAAKSAAASATAAGLKAGYVNAKFPFGSTNVEPVALAMKAAGVDGVTPQVDPNTGFALVTALRQAGVNLKVALLPTGYGGDLLQAGPGALQAAQNVYFLSTFEPIEVNDAGTRQLQAALKGIGITSDPTYAEYAGYVSIALLVRGLDAAGASPTQASLISALSGIKDFDAAGLFGSHRLDLTVRTNIATGVDNCYWVTKLSGSTFQLVAGADPICGTIIPGQTVSAS